MIKIILIALLTSLSLATSSSVKTESWKKILVQDEITIFSKTAENSTLPFRASGYISKDLNSVYSILRNYDKKHEWAPKLEKVIIHEKLGENEFIFSEYYRTPWPATDREFLLHGKIVKLHKNKYRFEAKSIQNSQYESTDHIQADVKYINVTIESVTPQRTKINFEFHGDMKGWMPVWLMNLIQKKWPLRFIQGIQKYHLSREKFSL